MTDEEIIELARQSKQSKFCQKYHKPWDCSGCPITYEGYSCADKYEIGFCDGYKAALDVLIEKIKSL